MERRRFLFLIWLLVLLSASPRCVGQTIRIRIINGSNGHPLSKQQVSVSLLYEKTEKTPAKYEALLHLETDTNGVAQFTLPDLVPAHLSAGAHLTSEHWHCGCAAPLLVDTKDLIQNGIVAGREFSSRATPVRAAPGEIIFVARPFTFFERLLYPLLKG